VWVGVPTNKRGRRGESLGGRTGWSPIAVHAEGGGCGWIQGALVYPGWGWGKKKFVSPMNDISGGGKRGQVPFTQPHTKKKPPKKKK